MKRPILILFITIFVISLFSCGSIFKKNGLDLTGTWKGVTYVSISSEGAEWTLIIKKENNVYSGKLTDSMGYLSDAELINIELKENNFAFDVKVVSMGFLVKAKAAIENNIMTGTYKIEFEFEDNDMSGTFELEKEK